MTLDAREGVNVPYDEYVVREVAGYPVVTLYVRWTPVRVWQHWMSLRYNNFRYYRPSGTP